MRRWRYLLVAGVLGALVMTTMAQVERVLPRRTKATLEGTEFLLAFMENEVRISQAPVVLQIFLASEFTANVTVDFPDGTRSRYTINQDNVQVVDVPAQWMSTNSEQTERKSIRITSDVPIVAYALNSRVKSTDTYTAIPVKHFGTDYMVVSRGVDRYRIDRTRPDPTIDTTSRQGEFLIVANEDNTTVTYTTTARTERGLIPGVPFTITLQRGQTHLVKGARGPSGSHDLTGSRVTSDKPIGVFSGHVRASVPRSDVNNKDHLCEMLLPTSRWGFEHVTTPFQNTQVGDMIRIVAQHDETIVTAESATMKSTYRIAASGGWIEFPNINFPVRWTSNRPVMVAQTMMSNQTEPRAIMDPAMVIVPAVERYVERAVFRVPELLPQQDAGFDDYAYYFSVIAEDAAVRTLTANGSSLLSIDPGFGTRYVPGTKLCYASFRVEPATFVLESTTGKFSGVMYGVGPADSYANIYGMSLDSIVEVEQTPPAYALQVDCGDVEGTISDVGLSSRYLAEVTVVAARSFNFDHSVQRSLDSQGKATVWARVKDRRQDARLVIHAWDSLGNGKEWDYFYDAPNIDVRATVIDVSATPPCSTIVIRNRDGTPARVDRIRLTGDPRYRLPDNVRNAVIKPGDSLLVRICLDPPYFPTVPPAVVHIDMPCEFSIETPVRPLSGASIATVDLDVGDVRVGDTACGDALIINDGIDPVTIDSLRFQQPSLFAVDTVGLSLPRILMPGDTLRVRACLTPERAERTSRTDTVVASPALRSVVRYRGRGVQPQVRDIVIDWGLRRAGTRHDSVFVLSNSGNASCVLDPLPDQSTAFDIAEATRASVTLRPSFADTIPVAFTPAVRSRYSHQLGYVVDWRYHDTVRVLLKGVGTMPGVQAYDIDMGSVRIDASKDSTVDYALSDGDEVLSIDTMWVEGPDAAAFTVDPLVLGVRSLDVNALLSGALTFAPRRVGMHAAQVVIVHDAAPAFERRTSRVNLSGVGLALDTFSIAAALTVDSVVPACVKRPVAIRLTNTGNIDCDVLGLRLSIDGGQDVPLVLTLPLTLAPGQTLETTVDIETGAAGERRLRLDIEASNDIDITIDRIIAVQPHAIDIATTTDILTTPGSIVTITNALRVTGPETAIQPVVEHMVGAERLHVTATQISATVDNDPVPVLLDVRRQSDRVTLTPTRAIQAPFELTWSLSGVSLWKDAQPFDVETIVRATDCTKDGASSTRVSVDICASNYRMVRLGLAQLKRADVRPMPVYDNISVIFETTDEMVVSVDLIDMTGAIILHCEKIDLKKGTTVCNFNCSTIASGTYRLRVGQGIEHIALPLVIVN